MNFHKTIKISEWKRCEQYLAYQKFDNKLFNVSFNAYFRPLYDWAKRENESFFVISLFALMQAMNQVPQFRQRHWDDEYVIEYDHISIMSPIMNEKDEQFSQILIEYTEDFEQFKSDVKHAINAVNLGYALPIEYTRKDLFVASCSPWFTFTSITHALASSNQDLAILAWGRMDQSGNVPISFSVNHSFVDGFHVGRFIKALEDFVARY